MIIKAEDKKFATIASLYYRMVKKKGDQDLTWTAHLMLFKAAQKKVDDLTETEIDTYWS